MGSRVLLRRSSDVLRKSWLKGASGTPQRTALDAGGPSMLIGSQFDPTLEINYVDDPRLAVGETFTRATVRTVIDFEGRVVACKSGEVGFWGFRRVANIVATKSEDISNAAWTKFGGSASSALRLKEDSSNGEHRVTQVLVNAAGSLAGQVEAARVPGSTRDVQLDLGDGGANTLTLKVNLSTGAVISSAAAGSVALVQAEVERSGSRWRLKIAGTGFTANATVAARMLDSNGNVSYQGNGSSEVEITKFQVGSQNTQSTIAAAEYVSVGVLASPFHGANVDGVKYFVTKPAGTLIARYTDTAPAYGRRGALIERSAKNCVLQSENFGATWVAVGTPTRTAAAKMCGDLVLDLIGDDDAAALEGYTQAIVFTGNAVKAVSVHVAQDTSTSSVVRLRDTTGAADRLLATITWAAGVPSVAMTTGTLIAVDTLANGVFRIRMLSTAVTAANVNSLEVYPATTAALAVANTGRIYAGGVQPEDTADRCTSYIPTTVAAVTRNSERITLAVNAAWYNSVEGSFAVEAYEMAASAAIDRTAVSLVTDANNRTVIMLMNTSNNARLLDQSGGVTDVNIQDGNVNGTLFRAAAAYKANDFEFCINAAQVGTDVAATVPAHASLDLGSSGLGSEHFEGGIARVWVWPKRLATARLCAAMAGI